MNAYQEALRATSTPDAPWFAVPADDKPYMRWQVARTVVGALEGLDLHYPKADAKEREHFAAMRKHLEEDG